MEKDDPSKFGAVIVENGLVKDIVEKPKTFVSNLVNVGMYCFTKDIFTILENLQPSERGEYEITDAIKILASKKEVHYELVQDYWIPVGYPWHIIDRIGLRAVPVHKSSGNQNGCLESVFHCRNDPAHPASPAMAIICYPAGINIGPGFQVINRTA